MKRITTYLLLLCLYPLTAYSTTYYVKATGAGNKDGSSWANASDDLQAMINKAQPNDQVFVAGGSYYPTKPSNHLAGEVSPTNRDNAFVLKKDVKIYGSFPYDANDQDHTSIDVRFPDGVIVRSALLGDIAGNKDWSEFAHHIVISVGDVGSALLDGFEIANGNARGDGDIRVDGYQVLRDMGGGIYAFTSSPTLKNVVINYNTANFGGGVFLVRDANLTLHNALIQGNQVTDLGGGMYINSSSPTIEYVNIIENFAKKNGGGINNNLKAAPTILQSTIKNNEAKYGGGVYNFTGTKPTFKNVNIWNNKANFGGGVDNQNTDSILFQNVIIYQNETIEGSGGGMSNGESHPILINVLIAENKARIGGAGMYNHLSSPEMTNVTLANNSAGTSGGNYGGGIKNEQYSRPKIYNSIVSGNFGSPQVYNDANSKLSYGCSLIETVTKSTSGNIDGNTDPLLIGDVGEGYDYYLQANSPCIDAGNNKFYTDLGGDIKKDTDMLGNPRFSGTNIDMGCYEFPLGTNINTPKLTTDMEVTGLDGTIKLTGMLNRDVYIYDLEGKLVFSQKIDNHSKTIPFAKGCYIVSLTDSRSWKVIVK